MNNVIVLLTRVEERYEKWTLTESAVTFKAGFVDLKTAYAGLYDEFVKFVNDLLAKGFEVEVSEQLCAMTGSDQPYILVSYEDRYGDFVQTTFELSTLEVKS